MTWRPFEMKKKKTGPLFVSVSGQARLSAEARRYLGVSPGQWVFVEVDADSDPQRIQVRGLQPVDEPRGKPGWYMLSESGSGALRAWGIDHTEGLLGVPQGKAWTARRIKLRPAGKRTLAGDLP